MKFIKLLLSLLLVMSLVACSDTNTNDKDTDTVAVNYTTYTALYNEYGAAGVTALHNTLLVDGNSELLFAQVGKIDASHYEAIKSAISALDFVEGGTAGNLIARVDVKKYADIMYLNVYDNGTVGVCKHPEETVYTVSQDKIDVLVAAIVASYDAYQVYLSGK